MMESNYCIKQDSGEIIKQSSSIHHFVYSISASCNTNLKTSMKICSSKFIALVFVPVLLSGVVLVYHAHPFQPAPFPLHEFTHQEERQDPALVDARMLDRSHFVGSPHLQGPEDLVYDSGTGLLYTGCADGWIKTFDLNASVLRNWVNTGGRPLGVALSGSQLIVADGYKGLLRITEDKKIEVLTNAAEGLKFNFADGVDVGKDGTIYFTDASYKYQYHEYLYDLLESRPHGRLLSFNPNTNETKVLLHDLYFPNGVAISPDQSSLIFCETPLKRCRRYWLQGSKKGTVDRFVENTPGFPDNIHCDGEKYWIAIAASLSPLLEHANKLQLVRKVIIIVESYLSLLKHVQRNGGVYGVDLRGKPTAHFFDQALSQLSGAIKIGNQIYVGSLHYPHIIGFNMSNSQVS